MAQAELMMVLNGRVRDVVVHCRKGSPTYGVMSESISTARTGNSYSCRKVLRTA
jgi:dTDP-4-dehydrorhamnose 3,5-epimerase-like enzyme